MVHFELLNTLCQLCFIFHLQTVRATENVCCSPVASYNWTRSTGQLPPGSWTINYDRVLNLPKVKVEDQGEYICRAQNDILSIQQSVHLKIQGKIQYPKSFTP